MYIYICNRLCRVHTVSLFFYLAFIFNVYAAIFLKKNKVKSHQGNITKATAAHYEWKMPPETPLIVEISDVQDSFRWSELPVRLCGGFPQGAFPLFWMEEAYGRAHHICTLLSSCSGCLSLSLMLLCQEANQPCSSAASGPQMLTSQLKSVKVGWLKTSHLDEHSDVSPCQLFKSVTDIGSIKITDSMITSHFYGSTVWTWTCSPVKSPNQHCLSFIIIIISPSIEGPKIPVF